MLIQVDELAVDYDISGRGEPVLLLHGWGGRKESFQPLFDYLAAQFRVVSLDLPGFGNTKKSTDAWGVEEYSNFVWDFTRALNLNKTHIIAHSFGGRIAIVLAVEHPELVAKLVLVDSAGIRPKLSWTTRARVKLFRALKTFGLDDRSRKWLGSKDYQDAGENRATFVRVVSQDLRSFLPKIQSPTLLIWGENDEDVPVEHGKVMEQLIPDAGLVVLKDAGHFSYLDKFQEFCIIVSHFLENEIN